MNCKSGDIAIIRPGNGWSTDKLVECTRLFGLFSGGECLGTLWWVKPLGFMPVDCELNEAGEFLFPDARLRPIRHNDGEDEILRIAGYPACNNQPEHA